MILAATLAAVQAVAASELRGRVHVIDGDTLDVGATRVRLFGIDAPEAAQTCTSKAGKVWACGAWVSAQVRGRYEGKTAHCVPVDTDRYGRTVARCTVAGTDMGEELVAQGLAFAYRRYSLVYDLTEKAAVVRGAGLHGSYVEAPAAYRRATGAAAAAPGPGCRIKGNVSSKGARIYHRPGQRDYGETRISLAKGERWFCTEAEARAAGWRAAKR